MFVQIIEATTDQPEKISELTEEWRRDLSPGATGWLGTTAGCTDDGKWIAVVRFESEADARRNSDRPEQGEWWAKVAALFTSDPSFTESGEVKTDLNGNPDDAGFVQIIKGKTSDPQRATELMTQEDPEWENFRPDVIGMSVATQEDGAYVCAIYFTSEAEAREGEKKEMPAHQAEQMEEMGKLEVGTPTFLDLRSPQQASPK